MIRVINKIIKLCISIIAFFIKQNPPAIKYLFNHALKSEIINYYSNEYFIGYAHVERAIMLSKEFRLDKHIIVDVGGADGTTAKIFSKAFPKTKIYTFEPLRENYLQIQNLLTTFPNIVLFEKAVGSKSGKTKINKTKRITSSSLYKVNLDPKSKVFSDILQIENEEEIQITTLDESLSENELISILKIDVQGYELEVLKGAESVMERTSIIVLEMNNHNYYSGAPKYFDVDEYLRNKNFSLYDIFPSTKDNGQLKEWDSIYVQNDQLV